MKKQIVFIHGGEAFSEYKNYLRHIESIEIDSPFEVKERGSLWSKLIWDEFGDEYEVCCPEMPNKHNAKYNEWKIWFERHFEFLHDDVVLVGWSQGGYFLAKYLSENETPIKVEALYLIAAPFEAADFGGEDGGDFNFDSKNLVNVEGQVGKIHIFHSEDDFIVPYEHALKYEKVFKGAKLHTFEDRNHFLQEALPELIESIKGL